MSDFFSDLMARIDGTAAVLRPRLPSLFETPAIEPHVPPRPEASMERETQRRQVPQQAALQSETAGTNTPVPPPSAFRPVATGSPPVREASRATRAGDVVRETRETVRETIRPVSLPSASVEHPLAPEGGDVQAKPVRIPLAPSDRGEVSAIERPTPVFAAPTQPTITVRTDEAPFAPAPSKLRPNVPPRPETSKREAEPAIQISIGRIEIRATSDAPRAVKPKTSPVMSLDDYLRSRSR